MDARSAVAQLTDELNIILEKTNVIRQRRRNHEQSLARAEEKRSSTTCRVEQLKRSVAGLQARVNEMRSMQQVLADSTQTFKDEVAVASEQFDGVVLAKNDPLQEFEKYSTQTSERLRDYYLVCDPETDPQRVEGKMKELSLVENGYKTKIADLTSKIDQNFVDLQKTGFKYGFTEEMCNLEIRKTALSLVFLITHVEEQQARNKSSAKEYLQRTTPSFPADCCL